MKTDRLIGILTILLRHEKVTASYLAEKFEVSLRTINRDIETICLAGVPIVSQQGRGGGISIMDGYKIDSTLLTSSDMKAIIAGLGSLDSISQNGKYRRLMDKISYGDTNILNSNNHIAIDLSSWYRSSLAPKIELIQSSIDNKETVEFTYHSQIGESQRTIEPYMLVFKWSSWYLWGYCTMRNDFRMFKLNRMTSLISTGETFVIRSIPKNPEFSEGAYGPSAYSVSILFKPSAKWRLIDDYGVDSFKEQEDGSLLFNFSFTDKNWLFSWLLTFADSAKLLEPENLKNEFAVITKKTANIYK